MVAKTVWSVADCPATTQIQGSVRFHVKWLVYDNVKLENFSFVWQMSYNCVQINATNNDAIRIMAKYVFLSKLPDKKHLKFL